MSFRISATQRHLVPSVEEVVYYFDREGTQPLYELIVQYEEGMDPQAIAASYYGPPTTHDGEWRLHR